jgi:hypothetical protein
LLVRLLERVEQLVDIHLLGFRNEGLQALFLRPQLFLFAIEQLLGVFTICGV